MMVSEEGNIKIVDELLRVGASFDVLNKVTGGTALILASRQGHIRIVKSLLRVGADIFPMDLGGCTAIDHALRNKHTAVVALLKEAFKSQSMGSTT